MQMIMKPTVYMSLTERSALRRFIAVSRRGGNAEASILDRLSEEVERARCSSELDGPEQPVCMESMVTLELADSRETLCCSLVYPEQASMDEWRVSILAPIGIALIGAREGDEVEWTTSAGILKGHVRKVTCN
jgi:regulator of nucleoside diphosphate kinase